MNRDRDERGLRDQFETLRQEEGAGVMPFEVPHIDAGRGGSGSHGFHSRRWLAATLVLALAAVWTLSARLRDTEVELIVDLGGTRWVSPTDFLLETPGSQLLRTIPTVTVTRPEQPSRLDAAGLDTL